MRHAPPGLLTDVAARLTGWDPDDPEQQQTRDQMLRLLAAHPDAADRSCPAGHVTASAVVVNTATRSTLLTLHPKFGRWMQLGGHLEPTDATLVDAVLRETREESGLVAFTATPRLLSVGRFPGVRCVPGRVSTHFDVRYLLTTTSTATVTSDESLDLAWWPLDQLPHPHDDDLALLAAQASAALAGLAPGR